MIEVTASITDIRTRRVVIRPVGEFPDFERVYAKGEVIAPEWVKVVYVSTDHGPWELSDVSVSGPRRLKRGLGESRTDRLTFRRDRPDWMLELNDQFTPTD